MPCVNFEKIKGIITLISSEQSTVGAKQVAELKLSNPKQNLKRA